MRREIENLIAFNSVNINQKKDVIYDKVITLFSKIIIHDIFRDTCNILNYLCNIPLNLRSIFLEDED